MKKLLIFSLVLFVLFSYASVNVFAVSGGTLHLRASGSNHHAVPVIKIRANKGSDAGGGSWTNGYAYRRTIVASSSLISQVSNTALTNFPLLVSTTLSDMKSSISGGKVQNLSGYDIIFTSDAAGTNKLSWEMENYFANTGEMEAWVKMPLLSSSASNTVYMFYDKSGVNTFQSTATATWDGNYKVVYHMADAAANVIVHDSTANLNNASQFNTNNGAGVSTSLTTTSTGQIAAALTFGSTPACGNCAASSTQSFALATTTSFSAWIDPFNTQPAFARILETNYQDTGYLGVNSDGTKYYFIYNSGSGSCGSEALGCAYGGVVILGSWVYVVGTYNGSVASLYVNGSLVATDTVSQVSPTTQPAWVGTIKGGAGNNMDAYFDEVRISNIARSADWIKTEYNNQNSPSAFLSVSAPTAAGAASGTVFVKFR